MIRQERAQALAEGLAEGLDEDEKAGRRQEAISLLPRQMTARFGTLSTTTTRCLSKLTLPEWEELAIRFVTAKTRTICSAASWHVARSRSHPAKM